MIGTFLILQGGWVTAAVSVGAILVSIAALSLYLGPPRTTR